MATRPKASQLLNLLNNNELSLLKQRLVSDKRLRLLLLTENLLKSKNINFDEQERGELYQKLFKQQYTSEKDYLLRNEFRLLSTQVEKLLVREQIREEVEKNDTSYHYYLLRSLQERKALKLFQKEYAGTYDKAIEHQDYYAAHNITGLNFINFTQFLNVKEKDLPYIEKLSELKLNHLSCFYLTAFRQHQVDQQYVHNSLHPFSTERSSLEKKVAIDFEPFETDYSDYLFLKAKSYMETPENRIKTLEKCLHLANQYFSKNKILFEEEIKFCLAALAKGHSLLTEFQKSNTYYELFFEKCQEPTEIERLATLVDYITNLINLGQVEKALLILEENGLFMDSVPRLKLWQQCLDLACYSFLENPLALREKLPNTYTEYNLQTRYFFRFYFGILAYLEQRPEAAYREMENLRHLTSNRPEGQSIHPIVNFFHRYFYALHFNPNQDKSYEKNMQKLAEDIQEFSKTALPEIRSYLPFLWLKRKLIQ